MDPDRSELPSCRWIDQEPLLSRRSITYVDACLLASLVSSPVEVSVRDPRRLIDRFHIQIFANSLSKQVEIFNLGEIFVTMTLLNCNPITCLRRAPVLQPAVGITNYHAVNC